MGSQDLTSSESYQAAKPAAGMTSISQAQLASFWRRLGAYVVDLILIGVVAGLLFAIIGAATGGSSSAAVVVNLLIVIGVFAYFGYMWSSRGQTVGYMAMGIKVVRPDGSLVGPGRAIARLLLIDLTSNFLGLISAFMIGMGAKKQAIHDLIVDTLVVRA
jgi:uncharacterized RDD family membrane protein YckC